MNVYATNFVLFLYTTNLAFETLTPFWFPVWTLLEPLIGTLAAMDVILILALALAGFCFYLLLRRHVIRSTIRSHRQTYTEGDKPMRKRIIGTSPPGVRETNPDWLPLEQIAAVEVTSEESSRPVEAALLPGAETGWRAAYPGEQTLRLSFDSPQQLQRIHLVFIEREVERSQEFVLRWSPDSGQTFHEIVRQQWNFNPQTSAEEIEDYQVEFQGVTLLELKIVPDKSGGEAHASLAQLYLG